MNDGRDSIQPFKKGQRQLSTSRQMEPLRLMATRGSVGENEISDATGLARRRRRTKTTKAEYFKIVGYAIIPGTFNTQAGGSVVPPYHALWAYGQPVDYNSFTWLNGSSPPFSYTQKINNIAPYLSSPFVNQLSTVYVGTYPHLADRINAADDVVLRSEEYGDCIRIFPKSADGSPITQEAFISSVLPNTTVQAHKITDDEHIYIEDTEGSSLGTKKITQSGDYILSSYSSGAHGWRITNITTSDYFPCQVFQTGRIGASAAGAITGRNRVFAYPCELTAIDITLSEGTDTLYAPIIATEAHKSAFALRQLLTGVSYPIGGPIDGVLWPGLPGFFSKGVGADITYTSAHSGTTSINIALYAELTGRQRLHAKATATIADGSTGTADLGVYTTSGSTYKYYNGSDTINGVTLPAVSITLRNESGASLSSGTAVDIWYDTVGTTGATPADAYWYLGY